MFKPIYAAALALPLLAACAGTTQTPTADMYAAESAYAGALTIAVAYGKLPPCVSGGPVLCSDLAVVKKADVAAHAAWTALQAANTLVANGSPTASITAAVSDAGTAVQAFVSISQTLKVQ